MQERSGDHDGLDLVLVLALADRRDSSRKDKQRGSTENHRADGKQRREFTAGMQHGEVPLTGHAIEIAVTFPRGGEGNMYCPGVPV